MGSKKPEVGRTSSIPNGRHFHQLIAYGFNDAHDRAASANDEVVELLGTGSKRGFHSGNRSEFAPVGEATERSTTTAQS
jgi:hypothetical protein